MISNNVLQILLEKIIFKYIGRIYSIMHNNYKYNSFTFLNILFSLYVL